MGKGNDQIAQAMAVIGLILLIIAIVYALFAGTRDCDDDNTLLNWKIARSRVLFLFLAAIAFFVGALVWSNLDNCKKGGAYHCDDRGKGKGKNDPHRPHHGAYGAPAPQGGDYEYNNASPFGSSS